MPELQFLKTLIFPRAIYKLQNWVNFSIVYLKLFSAFNINASAIVLIWKD